MTVNSVCISVGESLNNNKKAYFFANVGLVAHKINSESKNSEKLLLHSALKNRELARAGLNSKILKASKAWVSSPFVGESTASKWYHTARKVITSMASFHLDTITWYEDSGYKNSKLQTALGFILDFKEGGDGHVAANTFQTLLSAASGDLEFRLMLAKASANTMPCAPMREQAEKTISGSSGLGSLFPGCYYEGAGSVVSQATHILSECAKNYNQTTRVSSEGIQPCKHLIHNEGKLNFEVDYWAVVDGILPDKSLTGKPGDDSNHFPYRDIYIPSEDYVVEVERTRIDWKMKYLVRDSHGQLYSGWVMTTSNLVICNGSKIIHKLRLVSEKTLPEDFALDFVEGVPGCGKTHYIINCVPADGVVIDVTHESMNNTRCRIEERNKWFQSEPDFKPMQNTKQRVRTLDSMLKFLYTDRVSAIFFDECFQEHSGKIMACIKLLGISRVQVLGDRGQIPYFSRVPGFSCIIILVKSTLA
ncbi:hypothetical protein O181_039576 [Austropuccinia psidii MF-1]|uniref:(+)RNA virus helicase C-terminal domain-containing protein n=1 Tax=Austropuccinia psidii MF-1 TaxID=1389203 RepID=A0A9Q3D9X1_9BASI|nr:hypothetical protein [Austropuccinia psidii MF-1]